ncbi:hypothetical protein C5Y96_00790 [Blastopirellula marina]|uniref:AsmA-like C-terminal domain-containing protein n=1 Tax=Blastopirellula marina TaxID=124 RepID=A0A2S8GAE3_9BACT|nr:MULTISPECIES: hypothetical protein [Pirellulaceae]PQO41280.1 hypothetical protein C5Y96_00790 [Blastopirellula marina]RCS56304.1 hypothetical protein DTL36_00790 [Bremerella cremea]
MNFLKKHWGKLLGLVGGAVAMLIVLVLAAPMIIGVGPVRSFLLNHLFNGKEVAVSVGSVSVGWFHPTEIQNLRIQQNEGKYNVGVPRIANDVTLFQLITKPRQLGNLTIEQPLIVIELPSEQADLVNDGVGDAPSLDQAQVESALQRTIDVQVIDATVQVKKPGGGEPWGFERIGFLAQLRPGRTEEEGPSILIPQATLMDRQQMTKEMCDDMLKFVAPIVTGATQVDGEISLSLSDIRVPLADRQNSVGKGQMTIHKAQLTGKSPMVKKISEFLGLGPSVEVFTDCTINFELADKQVYHEGLDFGIGNLRVRTRGFVGLDKSLNLIAEIPMPLDPVEELKEGELPRPILSALRGKTIEIPIVGTLDKPIIDKDRLGQSLMATAESTLRDILKNDDLQLNLEGENGEVDVDGILDLAGSLLENVNREGGMFDQMRERRETNPRGRNNKADNTTEEEDAPREGLFKRLLKRAQEAAEDPNAVPGDQQDPAAPEIEIDLSEAVDL